MKKVLFIDRDGTLIQEAPPTFQIDRLEKLRFYPGAIQGMARISREFDFELVMVSNQDGLGTPSFPTHDFQPIHDHILQTFEGEGVRFDEVLIDPSLPAERSPNRKPGIGMLKKYLDASMYDIAGSYVIGDRHTDIQLAANLGCSCIVVNNSQGVGVIAIDQLEKQLQDAVVLVTTSWEDIHLFLKNGLRKVDHQRTTNETEVSIQLNVDGEGKSQISTGLNFLDHMLDQLARHGKIDISIAVKGDLHVDEHHTIEDTGIALGEAFAKGLTDKRGMERYGFALPMDDAAAQVLIDFGGRNWIVWDAEFKREKIGDVPTEMFFHFFKSFSDAAKCNLNISSTGDNEHHKIESIFKAFAKAIRMAIRKDPWSDALPTTKGVL
ncbi:MAG: bifunctional histidinol-phosphatase/imidazoleglycerol-phosphate dehydratase HisB [Bacteroidetes bacterium]|nr:bifunctional histidinol-phosphatase/imidazoleglycerol-phosphate dehydratase HisB [Bacteroidota bacterium]